jgi:hypothetical protein
MPKDSVRIAPPAKWLGGGGNRVGFLSYPTHMKPEIEPISETHPRAVVINSNNEQIVNRVSRRRQVSLNLVLTPKSLYKRNSHTY